MRQRAHSGYFTEPSAADRQMETITAHTVKDCITEHNSSVSDILHFLHLRAWTINTTSPLRADHEGKVDVPLTIPNA